MGRGEDDHLVCLGYLKFLLGVLPYRHDSCRPLPIGESVEEFLQEKEGGGGGNIFCFQAKRGMLEYPCHHHRPREPAKESSTIGSQSPCFVHKISSDWREEDWGGGRERGYEPSLHNLTALRTVRNVGRRFVGIEDSNCTLSRHPCALFMLLSSSLSICCSDNCSGASKATSFLYVQCNKSTYKSVII